MIVQSLRAIQNTFGYLPDAELQRLARTIDVPLYRIQEVASFFPHFRREWNPPAKLEVKICRDMSCHLHGAMELLHTLQSAPELAGLSEPIHFETVSCLGRCDRAPVAWVESAAHDATTPDSHAHTHEVYAKRTAKELIALLVKAGMQNKLPSGDADSRYAVQTNPTWQIDCYRNDPKLRAYAAIRKFVEMHPSKIEKPPAAMTGKMDDYLKEKHPLLLTLKQSKLLGMGGAGVPIAQKWQDVWLAAGEEKYIVCNGDESEPGTFKDRELLLQAPYLIVEGVLLGCLMTGAERGIIFIRHEYTEQIAAIRKEIQRAYRTGAAGRKVFGSNRNLDIEVFESPGGYICGEQSALLEAMSDRRAQPRNRPPELATNGLFDSPTAVNNVETLAWVPGILLRGHEWYGRQNQRSGWGHRIFSISGDVQKPGVYEVPIGISLGELIDQYAGGMVEPIGAVATSGPSGGFLPAQLKVPTGWQQRLEKKLPSLRSAEDKAMVQQFCEQQLAVQTPQADGAITVPVTSLLLDLNFFRAIGGILNLGVELMLGAGIVVYHHRRNMLSQAENATAFFRNESCGKCVPCRIGSEKLVQLSTQLLQQPQQATSIQAAKPLVQDLNMALQQTSICGLGQVAANPIATWLTLFAPSTDSPG